MWAWAKGARWRGAYHWLRSDSSIATQADNVVRRVKAAGFGIGDFIQTDWEVTPNIPLVTSDQVIEFNDRVRQLIGRDCVITYSSDWLPDSTLDADSRAEFAEWREARPNDPLWYANYNTSTTRSDGGWAECALYGADIWQWTSLFTHPSIGNPFDMNHIFKAATLDHICGIEVAVEPPPPPAPTPEPIPEPVPAPPIVVIPPGSSEYDDDMIARMWKHPKYHNVWLVGPSTVHLSPKLANSYNDAGVPLIEEAHDQTLKTVLFQCGLTTADLVAVL